jgi:hypothetical protein
MAEKGRSDEARWLLLIHQIPSKPNYLRVKIWRHLQRLGAVTIKDSVYVLPANEQAHEDLNWVLREIALGGGDGSLVEARLVEGLSDEQVKDLFRAARDADYAALGDEARQLSARLPKRGEPGDELRDELFQLFGKLQKRAAETAAIDFFHARGREALGGLLSALEERLQPRAAERAEKPARIDKPRRATWVTRTGIHVDRIASAWLIKRFIDEGARFKFVNARGYQHKSGEVRFDMFDGELTHRGEQCTFEVLLETFEITDAALRPIAEMVHDIDLKESKHGRAATAGIEQVINAICMAHREDEARLERGTALFDDLHELYKRKRSER